jgi:hypothetical protein
MRTQGIAVGRMYELLLVQCCVIVGDGLSRDCRAERFASPCFPDNAWEGSDTDPTRETGDRWSISNEPSRLKSIRRPGERRPSGSRPGSPRSANRAGTFQLHPRPYLTIAVFAGSTPGTRTTSVRVSQIVQVTVHVSMGSS